MTTFLQRFGAALASVSVIASVGCAPASGSQDEAVAGSRNAIVDGDDAAEGQFPYQARIYRRYLYGGIPFEDHICGGSLIAPNFVLTAAHCVDDVPEWMELFVVLGDTVTSVMEEDEQAIDVAGDPYLHPSYGPAPGWPNNPILHNDFALLELQEDAELGPNVQIIALPTSAASLGDAIATGWA